MTLQPALRSADVEDMLTTSDIPGDDPTAPAAWSPGASSGPSGLTPKGPTGLLQALISATTTDSTAARALPTTDAAGIGLVTTPFDYDPSLAFDLDGDPVDVAVPQIGPTSV